jgi:hypothetical protein
VGGDFRGGNKYNLFAYDMGIFLLSTFGLTEVIT